MLRLLAAFLVLLGLSLPCAAVVAVDAANCQQGTHQYKTSSTTQTITGVTVTAGSNIAVVILVNFDINGSTTSPTVVSVTDTTDSMALSLIAAPFSGGGVGQASQIWGAVGIPAGASKTFTMVTTNPQAVFLQACAFTGVNQTGGATSFPGSTNGSAVTTLTVTSATGDIVINIGGSGAALSGITGTTSYNDSVSGSIINSFANYAAGSASVVIGQSGTSAQTAAVDIKAAAGAATATPSLMQTGIGP